MSIGYIYILSNPAMPGIVYINSTGVLGAHEAAWELSQVSRESLPCPFVVEFEIRSNDIQRHRSQVEIALIRSRVSRRPEFFRVPLPTAILCVTSIVLGVPYETDPME